MNTGALATASGARAATHILRYLHEETTDTWSFTAESTSDSFPVSRQDGSIVGHLAVICTTANCDHATIGTAAAAALASLAAIEQPDTADQVAAALQLDASTFEDQLGHGSLVAYFQPIVELDTGHVVAVEALARWQTAEGVLGPETFLKVLGDAQLLLSLFERMLDAALQFLADNCHRHPDLSATVNFEFAAIPASGLAEIVRSALTRHDVDPESITIELNERLDYVLSAGAVHQLIDIANQGVKLVLDDISSEFESLNTLSKVPIAGAKLDRRYVNQLMSGEREVAQVRQMLGRAGAAGLEVIAEGVETQAQCDRLIKLGCRFGQGYLFAVPQSATSLSAVLDAPLVGSSNT